MQQLVLIALLWIASGMAAADFVTQDPAAGYEKKTITLDADETGDFAVEGAGVKACNDYLSDRQKNAAMHYINLNWLKGFVTGVNYVRMQEQQRSQLGAGLDLDALTLYIDNYCNSNPSASLADAGTALVNELMY